ncbi:MAG: hypothetical protein OEY79_03955 [Anaplasmataceae bacterium]|nr:hypothetical protein [Anaplasmataceae bacterium]
MEDKKTLKLYIKKFIVEDVRLSLRVVCGVVLANIILKFLLPLIS